MNKNEEVQFEDEPLFSKERYDYFKSKGLSDEEIRILEQAEAIRLSTEVLPETQEETDKIFDMVEALPEDTGEALRTLHAMASTDPVAYAKIIATTEALDRVAENLNANSKQ